MATYVEVIEMHIRDAVPEDALSAYEVIRRSIPNYAAPTTTTTR
jgi:hypothetical protein